MKKRRTIPELKSAVEKLRAKRRALTKQIVSIDCLIRWRKKYPNWKDVIERAAAKIK